MAHFSSEQLQALCRALGDSEGGLTGSEIARILIECGLKDPSATSTKWRRLFDALAIAQNERGDRTPIVAFVRKAMRPTRHTHMPERFEPLRARVNHALAFVGIVVHESGELEAVAAASTLSEAEARASELRTSLVGRHLHPDVVSFCRAELVQKNYFHAVFEATKSVAAKLRKLTGLSSDGHELVQSTLEGDVPLLAINNLSKPSERTEQRGFANLLKGIFSMFRNPLAHEPKVEWEVSMRDAEDLMGTLSLIHRRLDAAKPNTFGGRLRD